MGCQSPSSFLQFIHIKNELILYFLFFFSFTISICAEAAHLSLPCQFPTAPSQAVDCDLLLFDRLEEFLDLLETREEPDSHSWTVSTSLFYFVCGAPHLVGSFGRLEIEPEFFVPLPLSVKSSVSSASSALCIRKVILGTPLRLQCCDWAFLESSWWLRAYRKEELAAVDQSPA